MKRSDIVFFVTAIIFIIINMILLATAKSYYRQAKQAATCTSAAEKRSYRLNDSSTVMSSGIEMVGKKEMKKVTATAKPVLKEAGIKQQELELIQFTGVSISQTVKAGTADSTVFRHNDKWCDISFDMKDSTFRYSVRDSITAAVQRIYRHRFLWWRWGVKGYKVHLINHNPNATIKYNRTVMRER